MLYGEIFVDGRQYHTVEEQEGSGHDHPKKEKKKREWMKKKRRRRRNNNVHIIIKKERIQYYKFSSN